jgi:5-methylcytosine-specific restriction enzyme subunit McrC
VKYKDKPERPDINQAVTYAVCYRTDQVVLLHQRRTNGRHGRYEIGVINGIRVDGYAFDLDASDIDAEEAAFATSLLSMTPAAPSMSLVA